MKKAPVSDHVVCGAGFSHHEADRSAPVCGRNGFQEGLNQDWREVDAVTQLSSRAHVTGEKQLDGNIATQRARGGRCVGGNQCLRLVCILKCHPILIPISTKAVSRILVHIRNQSRRHACWSRWRDLARGCMGHSCCHLGPGGAGRATGQSPTCGRFSTNPNTTQRTAAHLNQFEVRFGKHGTFEGMMFVLRMAEGTVEPPTKGSTPAR
jgi:hypothetical protein